MIYRFLSATASSRDNERVKAMKILITGAEGFVGKNLVSSLRNIIEGKDRTRTLPPLELYLYDISTDPALLDDYCADCDMVFNLAGVNRPIDPAEFMAGNFGFAQTLLDALKKHENTCPVMLSSSIHAALDTPYGKSKRAGEELFFEYGRETGARVLVYRFPNIFGKWCRPNYNSAVATFCYNTARGLPIKVNDRSTVLNLVYIDDVVGELINAITGNELREGDYCGVGTVYKVSLGEIADLILGFGASRENREAPRQNAGFVRALYSTYCSYIPGDGCSYELLTHSDARGCFTEILRTPERGQFSVNTSKPGIIKGNHWHQSKNEKFLVVSGQGIIRLRDIFSTEVYEYRVSGEKLEVVDIPAGYTHNIENAGEGDMVTFMWANECFDAERPDTYSLEV